MKKKIAKLSSIVALCYLGSANAITVIEDETNKLSVSGFFDISLQGATTTYVDPAQEDITRDPNLRQVAPRLNVEFIHNIDENTFAEAKGEWGTNLFASDYNGVAPFRSRLAYIGYKSGNDHLRVGKQWSAVYDVMYVTENSLLSDPDAAMTYMDHGDGGPLGGGRLDNSAIYRRTLGNLNIGLQYAFEHDLTEGAGLSGTTGASATLNSNYGFGATYSLNDNLTLGLAYQESEYESVGGEVFGSAAGVHTSNMLGLSAVFDTDNFKVATTMIPMAENYLSTGFTGQYTTIADGGVSPDLGDGMSADLLLVLKAGKLEPYLYASIVSFDGEQNNLDKGIEESSRTNFALGTNYKHTEQLWFGAEVNYTTFEERTPGEADIFAFDNNIGYGVTTRYFF